MRARRLFAACGAALTAACALVLIPAGQAGAHPLGNFTVNRYDGLVAAPGELRVDHVEDLAEIPATQAKPDIARLGMAEWARQRCESAARGSRVTVGGREVALARGASHARTRPGQAGLNTLRVECRLTAPLPRGEDAGVAVGFRSAGADHGPGWREITARGDRMTLTASDVPRASVSAELTTYPKALLSSPADTAAASLRIRPGGPALVEGRRNAPAASVLPRGADRWTEALNNLVARHHLTVGFAALALLIAVGLGAMHALAPGHGKTLMAATAAARGGRARLKDVLPLAASVTVTHTLGVVALGLLVTAGSAAAPSVIAWLGVSSGVLVTLAGVTLLRRTWHHRASRPGLPHRPTDEHVHAHPHDGRHAHAHPHDGRHAHAHPHGGDHSHTHPHGGDHADGHDHDHAADQEHPDGHDHEPGPGHPHDHDHAHGPAAVPSRTRRHDREPVAPDMDTAAADRHSAGRPERPLVLAHAAAAPRAQALVTTAPHPHPHPQDVSPGHAHEHAHPHEHEHRHPSAPTSAATLRSRVSRPLGRPSPALEHTHGGFTHTHEIAPTVRGTILLGFAGGLVPSPSAVVVLVGAAALGQAWFGLLLVLAYGVGLALTLTAAGFAVVRLGSGMNRALARRPRWAEGRAVRFVRRTAPLGSAAVVVALGVGLVLKGAASALG
ncbi:sulfite exporter TauE/SafE family protein [Streptomyces sp. NBC_00340]|uniref:urease accessory protein UreH domain-containing protein n=1 Tax=Streptomyces sp. NBC_00340 TaxID=2975716 RepID=UPI00225B9273|nr:sulfite exporter TauE/SafE family protein [Streptomyces sp. NBC_00340]MCX5138167.1 sulfite exporter TauE/SafE family protein [Streptomyces sp. NBC_00340]